MLSENTDVNDASKTKPHISPKARLGLRTLIRTAGLRRGPGVIVSRYLHRAWRR